MSANTFNALAAGSELGPKVSTSGQKKNTQPSDTSKTKVVNTRSRALGEASTTGNPPLPSDNTLNQENPLAQTDLGGRMTTRGNNGDGGETGGNRGGEGDNPPGGNEDGDNNRGTLVELSADMEDASINPEIELAHAKWIRLIQEAFRVNNSARLDTLNKSYSMWCMKANTPERDARLYDIECDDDVVTANVVESSNTDCNKKKKDDKKDEVNTEIALGMEVNHVLPRLSDYFHNIMKKKNRHVHVSIFNIKWLLADKAFMANKKPKTTSCQTETIQYPGYTIPSEWRLKCAEWSRRFDMMVKYHQTIYDLLPRQINHPIAPRLLAHKEVVLQMQIDCKGGWPPCMRYDIAQRQNVWEHRLPDGRMADVGTKNETLMKQAIRDAEFAKDDRYDDNPYAIGNSLQNMNPENGQIYPEHASWDGLNIPNEVQLETTSTHLISASNAVQNNTSLNTIPSQVGPSRSQKNGGRGRHYQGGHGRGGHGGGRTSYYPNNRNQTYLPYQTPYTPPFQANPSYQSYQHGGGQNPNYLGNKYNHNHQPTFQNRNQVAFPTFPMIDPALASKPAIGYGSFVAPKQLMLEGAPASTPVKEKGKGPAGSTSK